MTRRAQAVALVAILVLAGCASGVPADNDRRTPAASTDGAGETGQVSTAATDAVESEGETESARRGATLTRSLEQDGSSAGSDDESTSSVGDSTSPVGDSTNTDDATTTTTDDTQSNETVADPAPIDSNVDPKPDVELVAAYTTSVEAGQEASVVVMDGHGNPVEGATVRVDGEVVGQTNADGRLTFTVPGDAWGVETTITKGDASVTLEAGVVAAAGT